MDDPRGRTISESETFAAHEYGAYSDTDSVTRNRKLRYRIQEFLDCLGRKSGHAMLDGLRPFAAIGAGCSERQFRALCRHALRTCQCLKDREVLTEIPIDLAWIWPVDV